MITHYKTVTRKGHMAFYWTQVWDVSTYYDKMISAASVRSMLPKDQQDMDDVVAVIPLTEREYQQAKGYKILVEEK